MVMAMVRRVTWTALGAGVAILAASLAPAGPAAAMPGYGDTRFACEGVPAVIESFDDPAAQTTWAHWGTHNLSGYSGDLFASSRVRVVYLDGGWAAPDPIVDGTAPRGQKVVTCRQSFQGATARVIFLSPPPSSTPPLNYLGSLGWDEAAEGRYLGWVVRSTSRLGGCFPASPREDPSTIRMFCVDDPWPELWDIVNIDYRPGGDSRVTVRGTLTSLKGSLRS
jgi:hypothetical protein